jgi:hypothetical protein
MCEAGMPKERSGPINGTLSLKKTCWFLFRSVVFCCVEGVKARLTPSSLILLCVVPSDCFLRLHSPVPGTCFVALS